MTTPSAPSTFNRDLFLADRNPPVCSLQIKEAFEGLTQQEKLYSHHVSQACWAGARIIMTQTTPHAERIYDFVVRLFESEEKGVMVDMVKLESACGLSKEEWEGVLSWSAQVLSNLSNIKSFGSTKFVPRIPATAFETLISHSPNKITLEALWSEISHDVYSTENEGMLVIGKPGEGHLSNYYPGQFKVNDEEVEEVQALCDKAGVSTLNTRLSKTSETTFDLLIASASGSLPATFPTTLQSTTLNFTLHLRAGDFSSPLSSVNGSLLEAIKYAEGDNQKGMLKDYVGSFESGDVGLHKEGSRKWVKDVGPVVESYIGFIESYVDPYGGRAEWEGFVAVVNKEQSKKFNALVDAAPELIKDLPWGPDFEVDTFKRPDFTALEILSFATAGIPAGINIPNYSDVRANNGFKNVSLSNILSAKAANEEVTFVSPDEVAEFEAWQDRAFEMQVANHELLGHGSGKEFQEGPEGTFNFDREIINPLTGRKVESWYKNGETYGSKVGPVSSSMEECRAESVALYLASNTDILELFNFKTKEDQEKLIYYTFLIMARAGVRALEFYDPKTQKHGQAHMEARLGITNWLMQNQIAHIEEVRSSSGELTNAYARINKAECLARGKEVMGKLLLEIQVRKSTGDGKGAASFYKSLTTPPANWISELRPLVLSKKLPRKIFVQPNTVINAQGEVELREYDVSLEGVIRSFVERAL